MMRMVGGENLHFVQFFGIEPVGIEPCRQNKGHIFLEKIRGVY
jgi:hypothetical protein